jgi:ribose 5-phosphate isomerase B
MEKTISIAIGNDHRGVEEKKNIIRDVHIPNLEINWLDVGCFNTEYCDYPKYAKLVVDAMLQKKADRGILLCATGVGMAIAANRFDHIYAALVWNEEVARLSREHDYSNILVLPSDYVTGEQAVCIIQTWLKAKFLDGKYQKRITMIDTLRSLS